MHRRGEVVETKLQRIAEKALRAPEFQFTSLFHLMNEDFLRGCLEGLRKDAASGIDRVTKEAYGRNIAANLQGLVSRLHAMSYRPQPVCRVYIPKPGSSKQRPLGIPALEDKVVQAGVWFGFWSRCMKRISSLTRMDFVPAVAATMPCEH